MKANPNELYIFEGLSDKEIAYFIMMSETIFAKSGTTIMTEGDTSDDRAYFIERGSVDVFRGEKKIASLHAGDIFGELALITAEPRTATIRTIGEVELLAFSKEEFLMLYKHADLFSGIRAKILARVKDNFYGNQ